MDRKIITKLRAEIRRTAYIFITIGAIFLFIAILFFPDEYTHGRLIFNIGFSVIVVGLIARVWDLLGGDPQTNAFKWLAQKHYLEKLGFDDLIIRKSEKEETSDLFSRLYEDVKSAKSQFDMMGLVLWRNFFKVDEFNKIFLHSLSKKNFKFRILILKPFDNIKKQLTNKELTMEDFEGSEILSQRAVDEALTDLNEDQKKESTDVAHKMHLDIKLTLGKLKYLINNLDDETKGRVEVRVTNKAYINCSIFRVDSDHIIAIHFLHNTGGGGSPTIQAKGPHTELFNLYRKEFEIVWKNSQKFNLQTQTIETN